ncbi:TIGR02281 family clan AA aspartic protease [uncultured Shimia sp.]|uniref:retropepsin-like aspartic protease family protein n=1 Tax=uncultured Shimia sp. TaxID=573152 RepID=UPI00261100B4|nr:TIGR02281 family clan AA aspartic protease [uncultured Shimia sp.]
MDEHDYMSLVYLVVLGSAVIFWFVTSHRQSFSKNIQQGLAWVLIFVGVLAAYGMWEDIRSTVLVEHRVDADTGQIEIPRSPDGHYRLALDVNGSRIDFVVDTGATDIVLSKADAIRAGFDPEALPYFGRAYTANGEVRTAPVELDEIRLGDLIDRNIPASINEGELNQSLLGMRYLQQFSEITITGGKLILTR